MPPKAKAAANPNEDEANSAANAVKDPEGERLLRELQLEAKRLRAQCESEEKLYNQFLQERERANYFWIVERKALAEKQSELRNKERELQDLEERHAIELKMFQQRLKHLRFHHIDASVGQKIDAETALKLMEDQNRSEIGIVDTNRNEQKLISKEAELYFENNIRRLKFEQDKKTLKLRQEFDSAARDLQKAYALKMKTLRDDMERERKGQIAKIEEAKTAHIQKCMQRNMKSFTEIKLYYGEITASNLELIKRLKEEHSEIKKRESADAKQMFDLRQKNAQLSEPLRRTQNEVERLASELTNYDVDKTALFDLKEVIKNQEKELNRLQFQQEVLLQQSNRAKSERDSVYNAFQKCIYDVQQKSGLKNLIIEKKVDTVEETLEVADAEISELLVSGNIQKATAGGISQRLDDIIRYKNEIISELHEEITKIREAHSQMLKAYEAKMAEQGITRDELGFIPQIETDLLHDTVNSPSTPPSPEVEQKMKETVTSSIDTSL